MYLTVCLHVCICTTCVQRPEGGFGFPGTDVAVYEPPCPCWELNVGSQQEQVLLITDRSLQASK